MVKKLLYICHATSRFVIGCVFVFSFILTAQAQNLPDKPTKEVTREIALPVLCSLCFARWKSRDAKHLSRPLSVRRSHDGRMEIEEFLALKEIVNGHRSGIAHAENGANRVRTRPKVLRPAGHPPRPSRPKQPPVSVCPQPWKKNNQHWSS